MNTEEQAKYLEELKSWLSTVENAPLEEMDSFFTARLEEYEEHMLGPWAAVYSYFPTLLPENAKKVLDLGCGTGLELDEIFKLRPELSVTGIDLTPSMLEKLREKHPDKDLTLINGSYFDVSFPGPFDAVISFESIHHFTADEKRPLFKKIYDTLKDGGVFLNNDYFACCDEEEKLLRDTCDRLRKRRNITDGTFVHFDTPLTAEKEMQLLREVGFSSVTLDTSVKNGAVVIAKK